MSERIEAASLDDRIATAKAEDLRLVPLVPRVEIDGGAWHALAVVGSPEDVLAAAKAWRGAGHEVLEPVRMAMWGALPVQAIAAVRSRAPLDMPRGCEGAPDWAVRGLIGVWM